jgi:hypothetical protein
MLGDDVTVDVMGSCFTGFLHAVQIVKRCEVKKTKAHRIKYKVTMKAESVSHDS